MELALLILKKYWPAIAIGLVVVASLSYIKILKVERDHYKGKAEQVQQQFDKLVKTSELNEKSLKEDNAKITAKYRDTLKDSGTLIVANAKLNQENIKNAKELRDVKLSLDALRLFNASKQSTVEGQAPTVAVSGNATGASTTQEAVTLQDMLLVVNENDANHLKCIDQVHAWQKFWKDYQISVNSHQ
jgi:hypothetical protein